MKLLGVGGGVLALTMGERALSLLKKNPEFTDLVANSIREGKVLEDIGERLQSRFNPDTESLSLGETLSEYSESWMEKVSSRVEVIKIPENESQVAFIDITESTHVTALPFVKKVDALPTIDGSIRNVETYSLDKAMNLRPFLTLPIPQYVNIGDYANEDGISTYGDYQLYRMYAGFRVGDGSWNTEFGLRREPAGVRGGIVLTEEGKLIAVTPAEFATFNHNDDHLQAQMEYAFVLDSNTLEGDLAEMGSYGYGKDLTLSSEYANTIVTFYDKFGNFQTKAISLLALFDEVKMKFGVQPSSITVTQLAQLVNKYALNNDFARYVMVVPDGSGYSIMSTPLKYSLEFANEHMPRDVARWALDAVLEATDGENPNLYRILGTSYENLRPHVPQFPFMLTSSIK